MPATVATPPVSNPATPLILGTRGVPKMERDVITRWFADKGDQTLRLDYPLTADSVVFDIGGYEGNWAAQIDEKYGCEIHIFEPVPAFAENIRKRFAYRPNIRVHAIGISDKTQRTTISIQNDGTSIYKSKGTTCEIQLQSARSVFKALNLRRCGIDLMKINIEGCEYDLLPHLIETGLVESITDIQVQFHDFVANPSERMEMIQAMLGRTHELTWQYRFVWENWRRRADGPRGATK